MSVTIITPSFNKSKYIIETIKSVVSQTHRDWTYFIVDNSTDGITRDTIKSFLQEVADERIKYLEVNFTDAFREEVYVPSVLCNALILLADKKYLFYLSDDDVIHELCLESMSRFLDENKDVGACYCRGERMWLVKRSGEKRLEREYEFPFGETFDERVRPDEVIDGGQVMCRKSMIERIVLCQETVNLFLIPRIKGAYSHSDGIFLNKLVHYTKIPPCTINSDKVLMSHRCTELSQHKQ